MDYFRDLLFIHAFQVVPGPLYNQVSMDLRESANILFYEVVLRKDTPWEHLRDRVYPALARYLSHKSISPAKPKGVVVSLFFQDRFYLLEASEFMEVYRKIEEMDSGAFHTRVDEWLAEPEAQEEPPAERREEYRRDLPAIPPKIPQGNG
jgi:hypothetical protein